LANLKSAIKRARQNEKRRARNRQIMSRSRTAVRQANRLIAAGDTEQAAEAVRRAISMIDRAAQKGVMHKNKAARQKSRLMARFNAMH